MKLLRAGVVALGVCIAVLVSGQSLSADEVPHTGPVTEKRFPPLNVPDGFKATLFACDPLIEYPSAICAGPRVGAIFVAIDYMTGLGTEIIRRDEVRLVADSDGDGYADEAPVFADGFNSIMGLAWQGDTLYVMHAPLLTALRDRDGDGKADERTDLLKGLGLAPEDNDVRLHCANGVVVGHDGWLYLALGDHGCDVARPEGDRLVLQGGGILRCRADGRDLHVFASGLRNIYDVALDAELNVFVRDNENDGGTYKQRICHSFHGADHGYPYLYDARPDEALPPLADLGLGSSAGGLCYLERQFPAEYRGSLLFCEWGRAVMRFPLRRAGSSFATAKEIELAAGAADDPYGFKPTDLAVERDGTLIVADWADGQRPQRGRGRIYAIRHVGGDADKTDAHVDEPREGDQTLAQLDSASYMARCDAQAALARQGEGGLKLLHAALDDGRLGAVGRLHAVWILAQSSGEAQFDRLLRMAKSDAEPTVRAQAVRAIADGSDPVLTKHRLDAGAGDAEVAGALAALGDDADARVQLEVVVALARLRARDIPAWLEAELKQPNAALAHAAMILLRQSANWTVVLNLLDQPDDHPLRWIALRALAERYETQLVDGLIARLRDEPVAARRQQYADALARVYKQPGPWSYWGYRPGPRPANTARWERTDAIAEALGQALRDPDRDMRWLVLQSMRREQLPAAVDVVGSWLVDEDQAERAAVLIEMLRQHPPEQSRPYCEAVVRARGHSAANRLAALDLFTLASDESNDKRLVTLASELEQGPVLVAALQHMNELRPALVSEILLKKLSSPDALVQSTAITVIADQRIAAAREQIVPLLAHPDARVRRAAAGAAGALEVKTSADALLKLLRDDDALVRRASLSSLRMLREVRAIPFAVAALNDERLELAALELLTELGGPEHSAAVANLALHHPTAEVLPASLQALAAFRGRSTSPEQRQKIERAMAEIQGASGTPLRWEAFGPLDESKASSMLERLRGGEPLDTVFERLGALATGPEARVVFALKDAPQDARWLATSSFWVSEPAEIESLAGSSGTLRVWLNGEPIYARDKAQDFAIDAHRFSGKLAAGDNRWLVEVAPHQGRAEFHLRFRRKSATAKHEALIQAALARAGNAERGRAVLRNSEKSLCLKCHRLGDRGERVGPELTGVGSRFSRIHLVESIIEPSRAIAPSFESLVIELSDGKLLTGVRVAETETTLTLADNQGVQRAIAKADIAGQQRSPLSTMPDGLAERLTEDEFVDLISFLANQRDDAQP